MISTDLRTQQAFDVDPKAIQQINFTGSLEEQSKIFFIIEKGKETVLGFSKGAVKVLSFYSNKNDSI